MQKKLLLLIIFLLASVGYVSADHYQLYEDDSKSSYGGEFTALTSNPIGIVNCGSSGCTHLDGNNEGSADTLEVCNTDLSISSEVFSPSTGPTEYGYSLDSNQNIPEDLKCSSGNYNITLIDGNNEHTLSQSDQLEVDPVSMDRDYGKFLYVNMDVKNEPEIFDFYLSNDNWAEDTDRPDPYSQYPDANVAWVMVNERDALPSTDPAGVFAASPGNLLKYGGSNLGVLVDDVPSASNEEPGQSILNDAGQNNDGNCNGDPCEILNDVILGEPAEINDPNIAKGVGSDTFFPESVTGAHQEGSYSEGGGAYLPDGEIMVGELEDPYDVSGDAGETYFFICREGTSMQNNFGEEIPMVIDIDPDGEELRQCDTSTQKWEPINSCNDRIDNDEDGRIDHSNSEYQTSGNPDYSQQEEQPSGCSSPSDSELTTSSCKTGVRNVTFQNSPRVGGIGNHLAAQYEESDGSCSTSGTLDYYDDSEIRFSTWKDSSFPETYECSEGDTNPLVCVSITEYHDGGNMEVVEYQATKDYFTQLANADESIEDLKSEAVDTAFVQDGVGWTNQYQTLEEAEDKYTLGLHHSFTNWKDRIKQPEVNNSYDTSSAINSQITQSWTPQNAGVNNEQVISSASIANEQSVFDGGFAGLCPDGQYWQFVGEDSEWACSGDIDWEHPVYLPQTNAGDTIGIVIPHTNFMTQTGLINLIDNTGNEINEDFQNYRSAVPEGEDDQWGNLEEVQITCYDASLSDVREGNYNNAFITTHSITQGQDDSIGMYVNMSSYDNFNGDYSCEWEYTAENRPEIEDVGEVIEMHGNPSEESYQNVTNEHFDFYGDRLEENYDDFGDFQSVTIQANGFNLKQGTTAN